MVSIEQAEPSKKTTTPRSIGMKLTEMIFIRNSLLILEKAVEDAPLLSIVVALLFELSDFDGSSSLTRRFALA
jgi:hypothetical protein